MAVPTDRPLPLVAFTLGVVAGIRSAMAPAAVLAATGSRLARWAAVASAGELVADMLPFVPPRTAPPALLARLASGTWCGRAIALARDEPATVAMAAGAIGALAGSFGGLAIRSALVRAGFPDPLVALAEDAAAVGLTLEALRA